MEINTLKTKEEGKEKEKRKKKERKKKMNTIAQASNPRASLPQKWELETGHSSTHRSSSLASTAVHSERLCLKQGGKGLTPKVFLWNTHIYHTYIHVKEILTTD